MENSNEQRNIDEVSFESPISNITNIDVIASGDIKGRFVYVSLSMDGFTRMIRTWRTSESAFEYISDVEAATRGIVP